MKPQDRSILCCPQVSCEPRTWHGWAQEGQLRRKPKSQAWEEVQAAAKTPETPCAGVGAEQGPGEALSPPLQKARPGTLSRPGRLL